MPTVYTFAFIELLQELAERLGNYEQAIKVLFYTIRDIETVVTKETWHGYGMVV